jgi:uncharacterized protein YgbK (DUF1537 family)
MGSDLLLSYYGDDLTGSTDVMEALALAGIPTVLFLDPPDGAMLRRFADCRAIGLAGTSRSETPEWMEVNLRPAFAWLKGLGARFCHYKVCSTFDSSDVIGSIGRAIDIGQDVLGGSVVPLVVGGPQLKRYTAFGELFAAYQGRVYRIDRHPVMNRHPVTPMAEADLRLHLGKQTRKRIGLADLVMLRGGDPDGAVDAVIGEGASIPMLDVIDAETQREAGRQLLRLGRAGPLFVAGSSGVEYALVEAWRERGVIAEPPSFDAPGAVERIAVVSGSVSPTTERQIRDATANGFAAVPIDPRRLIAGGGAIDEAVAAGSSVLERGRSVILHTAMGPTSDIGAAIDGEAGGRHRIGIALGQILRQLVARHGLRRAVIAGGDTSSHALRQLGVVALTVRLPLPATPGSPLCRAHAEAAPFDGLEIALKGGQIGRDDYFATIQAGAP